MCWAAISHRARSRCRRRRDSLRPERCAASASAPEERLPAFADIPTFKELGYPDLVSSTWFGLSGPANLPPPIVARLNAEVVKALHAPDVQARLESEAIDSKSLNAADFTAFFKAEVVRWTPIAKAVAEAAKAAGAAPPQ